MLFIWPYNALLVEVQPPDFPEVCFWEMPHNATPSEQVWGWLPIATDAPHPFLSEPPGLFAKSKCGGKTKDWVQTDAKEGDSRFRLLSLTQAGRRNLPVLAEIADRNDARYFDCLSSKEKNVLRKLLIKLADYNHINNIPTE